MGTFNKVKVLVGASMEYCENFAKLELATLVRVSLPEDVTKVSLTPHTEIIEIWNENIFKELRA